MNVRNIAYSKAEFGQVDIIFADRFPSLYFVNKKLEIEKTKTTTRYVSTT